jgi:hypothetical protein
VILPAPLARATAAGRKQTHRRPHDSTMRPGKRLAIRADGELHCHVEITTIQQTTLTDLTRDQAAQEGFAGARGPLNFRRYWLERYDKQWATREHGSDGGLSDEAVAARFNDRHVGLPITLIEWRVTEDPDLYLAAPGQGDLLDKGNRDYTRNQHRAVDPLPVIDPVLQERYAREAEASFKRDLEEGRKEQRKKRLNMFRDKAA